MDEQSTRDRVRALVREVLNNALPADEPAEATPPPDANPPAPPRPSDATATPESSAAPAPSARVVPVAPAVAADSDEPAVARDESTKAVITEDDVRGLARGARLRVAEGARLTPLAADLVRERGIELVRRAPRRGPRGAKLVAVGADHGGFKFKEELKGFLAELGHRVRDFGTHSTDAVDYPDYAHAVARAVADGEADLGIIVDGAGIGSAMTANKVPGVRAAACYSVKLAVNSREHNGANVLTLGSGTTDPAAMREIVRAWLAADLTEDRHKRRVAKIDAVERQYRG